MRTLVFEPGSKMYKMLYQGMLFSKKQLLSKEFRTVVKIQNKLATIGSVVTDVHMPDDLFLPRDCTGGKVVFEEHEWKLIQDLIEATPFLPGLARDVVALHDLLDATLEEEIS